MSLYHISSELNAIIDVILDGGADSPEAQEALDQHLAGLDAALESKAEAYAGFIRELELRSAARKSEADRIKALAQADAALADRLKAALKGAMESTGRLKIDLPNFKLSVSSVGGKQSMLIESEADLPDEYVILVRQPNKDAVRSALEAGKSVPGCSLLPRGTALRIR